MAVDMVQGYLINKPLSEEEALKFEGKNYMHPSSLPFKPIKGAGIHEHDNYDSSYEGWYKYEKTEPIGSDKYLTK